MLATATHKLEEFAKIELPGVVTDLVLLRAPGGRGKAAGHGGYMHPLNPDIGVIHIEEVGHSVHPREGA
jgi:hypothetical protein